MARFQFFFESQTDRLTDRQNRLLNPASRMRARGNYLSDRLTDRQNRLRARGNNLGRRRDNLSLNCLGLDAT